MKLCPQLNVFQPKNFNHFRGLRFTDRGVDMFLFCAWSDDAHAACKKMSRLNRQNYTEADLDLYANSYEEPAADHVCLLRYRVGLTLLTWLRDRAASPPIPKRLILRQVSDRFFRRVVVARRF